VRRAGCPSSGHALCDDTPAPAGVSRLMSLQCEAPVVDDSWRDEPLCSVEAPPDSKRSHPTAVAPTPDVLQGPVADPPSTTPAAAPPAGRCPTPILPWTPDQATPTAPITPPALYRRLYRGEQVSQGSPYQPLSPSEYSPQPELVEDAGRDTLRCPTRSADVRSA